MPQTKILQIVDNLVKQADNADTLDGKHASDFASASDVETLKTQVGDTAVSTQINEGIKDKANTSDLTSHTSNKSNPHEVTKAQVGLDNVTNDAQVKRTEMGTASGVATLDANKKVPVDQLPTANAETYGIIRTTEITDSGVSGISDSAVTLECFNYMADNAFMPMIESKANASDLTSHTGNTTVHITAEERTKWNTAATTASNVSSLVGDTAVSTQISNHNTSDASHNDIRELITGLTTRLNALADSDDTTLDQLSEIVAYIKSNRTLIEEVTTNKVNVSDIIDNLTTNVSNKPLSAAQGVAIKSLIDNLQTAVNGKADSEHTHDVATTSTAGFMSPEGKVKLDGIETGANKTIVDSALSSTSTNPVQNKTVNTAISNLNSLVGDTSVADQINTAIANNKEVFIATYGTTTSAEIEEAYQAGKIIVCKNGGLFYILTKRMGSTAHYFSGHVGKSANRYVTCLSDQWSYELAKFLPDVTADDNEKILKVSNGSWEVSIPPQTGTQVQILTWEATD